MAPLAPTDTADRLPPDLEQDYTRRRPRSSSYAPSLRAHESVPIPPARPPAIGDIITRARHGDDGAQWFADHIEDLSTRRVQGAAARKAGDHSRDHEAEGWSFASIRDLSALQQRLDFPVTYQPPPDSEGRVRATITADAFALAASNLATTDLIVAGEAVPTVVEKLVTDLDDKHPSTEVPEVDDFGHVDTSVTERPKPLGELEAYREVGASEIRYTGLSWRDGYQRAFSQEMIDLGGPRIFSDLTNLGRGAMEVLEYHMLRDIQDYDGSATVSSDPVMIRDRSGAPLFSSTANTPTIRTPNGTRIDNNALVDITDLENLRARLATMQNTRKMPSPVPLRCILVPDALWLRAWTLLQSQGVSGVFNELSFFGPAGPMSMELLSTPMLDLYSTTAWYGGDAKRQFVRKWRLRPEIAVHGGNGTLPFLHTREGFRVRIGWDCRLFVRAHHMWVQSLDGTTSPKNA